MKLEKITHDHLLTKWLKVIIFAILMLAPIFSVAIRCAYVVCNKNAYQSYYGETINEKTYTNVTAFDTNLLNKTLYIDVKKPVTQGSGFGGNQYFINFENLKIINTNYTYDWENMNAIAFYVGNNETNMNLWVRDNNNQIYSMNASGTFIATFEYQGNNLYTAEKTRLIDEQYLKIENYNDYSYLDNVFDYSVNQLKNDQLFNWTQQTGVYTGVNAMTTGLGLTDGTISILITYWTLLSIIYVIIDIVLEGFVALTHMILKKAS